MTEYQKLRAEFAKAALPAVIEENSGTTVGFVREFLNMPSTTRYDRRHWFQFIAKKSLKYSDALLKELGIEEDVQESVVEKEKVQEEPIKIKSTCIKIGDEKIIDGILYGAVKEVHTGSCFGCDITHYSKECEEATKDKTCNNTIFTKRGIITNLRK